MTTQRKTTTVQKENKMTTTKSTTDTKAKPVTAPTTTKEKKMTTQNKVEWKLVNAPQRVPNKDMTELEYLCKYKGETFMLINKQYHYDRCKYVDLYIVKNYVKIHISTIFSFIYDNSSYVNKTVDFDGIKIKFNQHGNVFSEPLPWTEIQEKAIKYIDEISND